MSAKSSPAAAGELACPRCAESAPPLPPILCSLSPQYSLCRCSRCGTRYARGADPPRLVFTCSSCGLPFLAAELLPHRAHRCPDCAAGHLPADLPEAHVTRAIERELRHALERHWKFVGLASLASYLDALSRQVARHVENAPESARVVLFEDGALRTLALPSGTLLLSLGTLLFLEDEAELVFVLAHELTHAACFDAAVRMVRLGFDAMAQAAAETAEPGWTRGAQDLIALGYGRHRERDADARGLEAVLRLGYDAQSVLRYLRRVQALVDRGDPRVAELNFAHPPALDRLRRLERVLFARSVPADGGRVNREVFRRAAGHQVLSARLERQAGFGEGANRGEPHATAHPSVGRWVVWAAAGLAAAAAATWLLL